VIRGIARIALMAIFMVLAVVNAHATGGSEWQPLWNTLKGYIEGYPGMIAAAFLVLAGLFSFYRGQLAQGGVAILIAGGIFLAPTIAQNLASGTTF